MATSVIKDKSLKPLDMYAEDEDEDLEIVNNGE